MKEYKQSDDLDALAEEVFDEHGDIQYLKENGLNICYLYSNEEKRSKGHRTYGECKKVPDLYATLTGFDFIITLYEPWVYDFTDEQKKILLYHELLHAGYDDGKKYIRNHDIMIGEFEEINRQYGLCWDKKKPEEEKAAQGSVSMPAGTIERYLEIVNEEKEEPAETSAEEKEEKTKRAS